MKLAELDCETTGSHEDEVPARSEPKPPCLMVRLPEGQLSTLALEDEI